MEKTIKMSLDIARKMYNDVDLPNYLTHFVLENFTKEELEEKKGYSWEESVSGRGYYIHQSESTIKDVLILSKTQRNNNCFKTEKQARSALAFAQLSHIVAKYNDEFKGKNINTYGVVVNNIYKLEVMTICDYMCQLVFRSHADATVSMKENNELWKQYWMID